MSIEKRNAVRHQVRVPCNIILDGIQVNGKLVNISEEGLGIEGSLPFLAHGKTVTLEIDTGADGSNRFVQMELEVKNLQGSNAKIHFFGGTIKDTNEQFHIWFERILNTLKSGKSRLMQYARSHGNSIVA